MPAAPAAAPAKKEKPCFFIFIDDAETSSLKKKKYPDGSSSFDFPTYSTTPSELDDWTKKNVISLAKKEMSDSELDIRRKNVSSIVKGDRSNIGDDDIPFIEKLKNAVTTEIFGNREPDTTVVFTKDGLPTTEDVKVTFIKYKK